MKLDELLTKLQQIEEQATLTLNEYPHGHTLERQRLIIAIAKQMQFHLRDQLLNGPRQPQANEPDPPRHLHAVPKPRM